MAPRFYSPFAFPASKLCLRRKNTVRSFSFSSRGGRFPVRTGRSPYFYRHWKETSVYRKGHHPPAKTRLRLFPVKKGNMADARKGGKAGHGTLHARLSMKFAAPAVVRYQWTCRALACSSVSSTHCQGRPRLLSSSIKGSGSFCSMLKTPAPDHLPVRIISAPIMAGTPVV